MLNRSLIACSMVASLFFGTAFSAPSEHFKVFLCFGQSNMSGGAGVNPEQQDKQKHARVMTFAFNDCSQLSEQKDKWYDAVEPLHCGDGVDVMGPAYAFGKVMADSLSEDTIGLVPCGQWGVSIEHFMKGKSNTSGNQPSYPGSNAYNWMMNRCKKAMERGVFSGIILHQGEANSGQTDWPDKVKTIYNDLKTDLGITKEIPLVAGELLYSGCCAGHNSVIAKLPETLPLASVAKADGLSGGGTYTQYHFNQAGYHELGKRFAVQMLKYFRTSVNHKPSTKHSVALNKLQGNAIASLYTIDGRKIAAGSMNGTISGKRHCLYVMQKPGATASLVINPN